MLKCWLCLDIVEDINSRVKCSACLIFWFFRSVASCWISCFYWSFLKWSTFLYNYWSKSVKSGYNNDRLTISCPNLSFRKSSFVVGKLNALIFYESILWVSITDEAAVDFPWFVSLSTTTPIIYGDIGRVGTQRSQHLSFSLFVEFE